MESLYDRIGGQAAVFATASLLYDKMLADERVTRFFAHMDMDAQIRKQVAFLSWAFGSPDKYQFRALGEAHRELVRTHGLSNQHFDVVAEHLVASLQQLGVTPSLIDEVMVLVASTRGAVLAG